jgi:formate hydrogenlyase subunit 3/multisubunit Na+/H+ antiporter MnhD subunit
MTVRTARTILSVLWLAFAAPLLLILIVRQLNGFYDSPGSDIRELWNWVGQFVLPGITLIAGAWTVSTSPSDGKPVDNFMVFWAAIGMSVFYFVVLYLVIASQASTTHNWSESLKESALYLGLFQGAIIAVIGKFFIESARQ